MSKFPFSVCELKTACETVMDQTYKEYSESYPQPNEIKILNDDEVNILAKKILVFPETYINVLFFKYYFNESLQTTESILEISNAKGMALYVKELLSRTMGYEDGVMIDDSSIEKACEIAVVKYIEEMLGDIPDVNPPHYKTFRKKLKQMNSVRTTGDTAAVYAKRAAIVVLAVLMGFAASLTVNAEWRETFFKWIVETFPQFSRFRTENSNAIKTEEDLTDFETLKKYKLNYLPDGFVLSGTFEANPAIYLDYINSENKYFYYSASLSNPGAFDTENATTNTIAFKEAEAFWWEKDDLTFFIWMQDGFNFRVWGQLDIEEVMKIAENVDIENS